MLTRDSPYRDDFVDDFDSLGVINALERTCELESKLRQAIQQTHPLTTTLDWDFSAADREREALLAIRFVADFAVHLTPSRLFGCIYSLMRLSSCIIWLQ